MARFYPLYVRRSDGRMDVVAKGKRKESNQPTDDQLDQRPDKDGISDFYREVGPEEPKHLDWRRKLAGMLARELDWKDKSGSDHGYMLVALPENYRLYEHIKKTEKDGKTEVKNKTHAAGSNDRQDAYLYGHPAGRRKRFRSPNDFFPHMLWLATDESGDPDNCSCKLCSPEDLENVVPGAKIKPEKHVKSEVDTKDAIRIAGASSAARPASMPGARVKQELGPQHVSTQQRAMSPYPLPAKKTPDQLLDSQWQTFMYRPGELVWFKRGPAWGIGIVLRRWKSTMNNITSTYYTIQPLSHPFNNAQVVVKQGNEEMRPWLAWSVPKFTNDGLNDQPTPPRYESADWPGILNRRYGSGDMDVDGSILAAKMIDATYTPFDKNQTQRPDAHTEETYYDGIFLGAEKIWVGDPVRLSLGTGTDILVVHAIVERKRMSAINRQTSVYLVGDIYQLATIQNGNMSLASPESNPHLPERLKFDLAKRNEASMQKRRTASYWKLITTQQRIDINDIKGRWYEATLILPNLHPEVWRDQLGKGDIQEASLWMNSRGDCLNSNRPPQLPRLPRENVRKETRLQAFDKAVPSTTRIEDGTQPPRTDMVMNPNVAVGHAGSNSDPIEIDPRFDSADDTGEAMATHHDDDGTTTLEDFMNLDGMEHEPIPGFEQHFGAGAGGGPGQGEGHGYF